MSISQAIGLPLPAYYPHIMETSRLDVFYHHPGDIGSKEYHGVDLVVRSSIVSDLSLLRAWRKLRLIFLSSTCLSDGID